MFKSNITPEEIEKMPLGSFPGQIHVIDKTGIEYVRAAAYLLSQKVIGFDTETRPVFSPGQKHKHVALLQLSGPDKAFLFRTNLIGVKSMVAAILSNPKVMKVGAAVHDDIRGLQYYNKFEAKNFVDLQKIGWEWGIKEKSVRKMAAIILGCKVSKTQQLSNWEAEKLTDAQQMYAATDAWICREMYLKLMASRKNPLPADSMVPKPQPQPQPQPQSQPQPNESNND